MDIQSFASIGQVDSTFSHLGDVSGMREALITAMVITDSVQSGLGMIIDIMAMVDLYWQNEDFFNPGFWLGHFLASIGVQIYYLVQIFIAQE